MKGKILAVLAVVLLAGPLAASAATLLGPATTPTGIAGLVIGTNTFDVSFVPGGQASGFDGAYGSPATLPFVDQSGAVQARDAIADFLLAQGAITLVDSTNDNFFVPFGFSSTGVLIAYAGLSNWATRGFAEVTRLCCVNTAWASFRLVGAVPEPGTLALLGLGLAGLGLSRRRKAA